MTVYKEIDCRVAPQREMRDWCGKGNTVSEIAQANTNKHRRVLTITVKTHHTLLTDVEYDSIREFCTGSIAIKPSSLEEQAVADYIP